MKIHHHILRKFQESKRAPLWKWCVVIFLIISMPMYFSLMRMKQMQEVLNTNGGKTPPVAQPKN